MAFHPSPYLMPGLETCCFFVRSFGQYSKYEHYFAIFFPFPVSVLFPTQLIWVAQSYWRFAHHSWACPINFQFFLKSWFDFQCNWRTVGWFCQKWACQLEHWTLFVKLSKQLYQQIVLFWWRPLADQKFRGQWLDSWNSWQKKACSAFKIGGPKYGWVFTIV
jgi:hypothetical protein